MFGNLELSRFDRELLQFTMNVITEYEHTYMISGRRQKTKN